MLKIRRIAATLIAVAAILAFGFPVNPVYAANLTSISDTLSTLTASTAANHTISFTTPTGVVAGETITVTFAAGFTLTSITEDDVDITDDTTDLTTAADCTGLEQAGVSVASQTITIEICSGDGGDIAAASVVEIQIGTNATASGTGSNQITNPTAANDLAITISGTMTDSGAAAVSIISDDSVAVTAQVDPSITFSISDTTIGFGDLTSANARFATGDTLGSDTDSAAAHTMAISTNATNGYAITYNGSTLTSGSDTITVASITDDADGTPGTEEFGMGFSTSGDAIIAAAYDHNATPASRDWAFVDGVTTTIVSETGPTATETISAFYLANISGTTEAGDYSTAITFIATATY